MGFVLPHFPLVAPPEFFDLYPLDQIPLPREADATPDHPVLQGLRACMNYADFFDDERTRVALAAYHGMVSYLDHNIGQLLDTLESTGLAASTRVIYTSDHGDNLGNRGFWGKSVMYDESTAVPLIMAGEGIPAGQARSEPRSRSSTSTRPSSKPSARPRTRQPRPAPAAPSSRSRTSPTTSPAWSSASTTRSAPRPACTCCATAAGSTSTTSATAPSSSTSTPTPTRPPTSAKARPTRRSAPASRPRYAPSSTPTRSTPKPSPTRQPASQAYGGPDAIKQRGDFGYTPAPGQTPVFG